MTSIITPVLNTPDIERLREDLGLVKDDDLRVGDMPRVVVAIVVEDCDATVAKVEAAGGSLYGPPNDMPWGHRVGHVYDPDGTMVNITQIL